MARTVRVAAVVAVLALGAAACGSGGGSSSTQTSGASSSPTTQAQRGGTLNLALTSDVSSAFDPQKEYYSISWEFFRCCLVRTLLSYNGKTTQQGGTTLFPDLASSQPQVSSDGLQWTFKIKPGIHYAPPLQNETVTAQDFIRALDREACAQCASGGYPFYYDVIKGFSDYSSGKAKTITGLAAPDPSTLVVTLTQPTGDFGYRMAMPATAPIPPLPGNPSAPLGVATGHDRNYGQFLSATGPYMFQGADKIDYTVPASKQKAAPGYTPGKSIVLVRNPSWDAATDSLRKAYVNEINVQITTASTEDLASEVNDGTLDMVMDGVPPPDQIRKYSTDPALTDQIHINPSDAVRYMSMNVAMAPFDDINVRKAVNYVIDKNGLRQLRGGAAFGDIAGHIIVNSLEGNQLLSYDPYATPNAAGDLAKAKAFMKLSKYDKNKDGVCDASACKNILTVIDQGSPYPQQTKLIEQDLAKIGMTLDLKSFERTTMYSKCNDPTAHIAFCPSTAWGKDFPDAVTFGPPLFSSSSLGPNACCNYSLLGATSANLKKWGYGAKAVPDVDHQINSCLPDTGNARLTCWSNLDRDLMQNVVPWVPYLFDNNVEVTGSRIATYSFDQFAGVVALDQLSLKGGGASS
jgi:peptide/nickel transport system substrate-binding protein